MASPLKRRDGDRRPGQDAARLAAGHGNMGGMAMTAPPLCAMGEHSLACLVIRFVILHSFLKYLHDESVDRLLVILRPTYQPLMEIRRHPNLEVNHSFGHCKLLKVLVGAGFDQVSNHNRWQIGGAIKKTDITNSFDWRRLWTDQRLPDWKPLIRPRSPD